MRRSWWIKPVPRFNIKTSSSGIWIPIVKIIRLWYFLIPLYSCAGNAASSTWNGPQLIFQNWCEMKERIAFLHITITPTLCMIIFCWRSMNMHLHFCICILSQKTRTCEVNMVISLRVGVLLMQGAVPSDQMLLFYPCSTRARKWHSQYEKQAHNIVHAQGWLSAWLLFMCNALTPHKRGMIIVTQINNCGKINNFKKTPRVTLTFNKTRTYERKNLGGG